MRTRCRVIAAVDESHQGDADLARRLIDAARAAGADGVKFRKRTVPLAGVRQFLDSPVTRYRSLGPRIYVKCSLTWHITYFLGLAYESLGRNDLAIEHYKVAASNAEVDASVRLMRMVNADQRMGFSSK